MVLWKHYREGTGNPIFLSHKVFMTFIIDMMMNGRIDQRNGIPVPGIKGLYQLDVNAYGANFFDYSYAVGFAKIYYNSTGIVGYSDWWNLNPANNRNPAAEAATTLGRNIGGQPFFVVYGTTPPLNQIKHD